jgi:hypothetical protein
MTRAIVTLVSVAIPGSLSRRLPSASVAVRADAAEVALERTGWARDCRSRVAVGGTLIGGSCRGAPGLTKRAVTAIWLCWPTRRQGDFQIPLLRTGRL